MNVELQEELNPADAVLLMSSAPERISDLVFGLDETRLRYRHGPAFPTLGGLLGHLLESGSKVDALLRRAHLEGLAVAYLLPRFIEPHSGKILIDGEDIAWVTLESLRAETIFVGGKDPFLTGSVRDNISLASIAQLTRYRNGWNHVSSGTAAGHHKRLGLLLHPPRIMPNAHSR